MVELSLQLDLLAIKSTNLLMEDLVYIVDLLELLLDKVELLIESL